MTINNFTNRIQEISLNHKEIKSFSVGNTWDQSNSKGDVYPAVWVEMPVLIEYSTKDKKYTFSLDVLMLPKPDDTNDELNKISQAEAIADQLTQAYTKYINGCSIGRMTGLSVKNINSDIACGVRIDLIFNTNKECDIENNFIEKMERL